MYGRVLNPPFAIRIVFMLFVIFLFAIVADFYIFFRYVWKKCQWRTKIQYAVFSSLSYMLVALIFRKYFLKISSIKSVQLQLLLHP